MSRPFQYWEPWSHRGFMVRWLRYCEVAMPDVARLSPFACHVVGAAMLNSLLNVVLEEHPRPHPATFYASLVGPTLSGKGTLLEAVETWLAEYNRHRQMMNREGVTVLKGPATAAGLRDALATKVFVKGEKGKREWRELPAKGPTFLIWPRMTPDKWTATLVEFLEEAYYARSHGQQRITKGARVVVDGGTYTLTFLCDSHPERWKEVLRRLEGEFGLRRRILDVVMGGRVLSQGLGPPDYHAAEDEMRILEDLAKLPDISIVVRLPDLTPVYEEIMRWPLDDETKVMAVDYVRRLTAATLVDDVVPVLLETLHVTSNTHHSLLQMLERLANPHTNAGPSFKSILVTESVRVPSPLTFVTFLTLLVPGDRDAVVEVARLWAERIRANVFRGPIEEQHMASVVSRLQAFMSERGPVVSKREVWLHVLGGRAKDEADRIFSTLEGLGLVIIRPVSAKRSYIVDPSAKICGSCRKFYFCDKVKGVPRRDRLEHPACEDYEPEVGG